MKTPKLTKEHAYLGHFRGCLKDGHNTNEMPEDNILTRTVKGDLPPPKKDAVKEPKPKSPLPAGIRG